MRFLFVLTLLISISSVAQKKCRYKADVVDEFSGERKRMTVVKIVGTYHETGLNRMGDKFYFIYWKRYRSEENFSLPKGSDLYLKLEDETIINLKSQNDVTPKTHIWQEKIVSDYDIAYEISKDDVEKIAKSGVHSMKIQMEKEYTLKCGKNKTAKIQENAACLLTD